MGATINKVVAKTDENYTDNEGLSAMYAMHVHLSQLKIEETNKETKFLTIYSCSLATQL
jgi:cytochrome c-type biogenesis protein CcmE